MHKTSIRIHATLKQLQYLYNLRIEFGMQLAYNYSIIIHNKKEEEKMKKTLIALVAILMVLPVMLAACGKSEKTLEDIKKAGTITMATCSGFEPFEILGTDGKVTGVDVDIAQAIADYLGVKLEISDVDFDSIVPGVQSGKYDLGVAGITANDTRRKNVDFSADYYTASQAIIVLSTNTTITSAEDVKKLTVGVQKGTTGASYCEENGIKYNSYDNGAAACLALEGGKVDAVIIDKVPATKHVEAGEGKYKLLDEPLTKENYAIAIAKENKELKDAVDAVLKQLTESGKLYEIFDKYNLEYDK